MMTFRVIKTLLKWKLLPLFLPEDLIEELDEAAVLDEPDAEEASEDLAVEEPADADFFWDSEEDLAEEEDEDEEAEEEEEDDEEEEEALVEEEVLFLVTTFLGAPSSGFKPVPAEEPNSGLLSDIITSFSLQPSPSL